MVVISKKKFTLKEKKMIQICIIVIPKQQKTNRDTRGRVKDEQVVVQIELLKPKDQFVSDSIINYNEKESDSKSDSLT